MLAIYARVRNITGCRLKSINQDRVVIFTAGEVDRFAGGNVQRLGAAPPRE